MAITAATACTAAQMSSADSAAGASITMADSYTACRLVGDWPTARPMSGESATAHRACALFTSIPEMPCSLTGTNISELAD
ncbi:hypothetical protein GCM10010421_03740 [Streptomyces glaucus]|uniref:Secreted protein n=1 Tax=Streptomyces glaucus TaxID=284029 RepID=A0ABP5W9Y1_9ACTN